MKNFRILSLLAVLTLAFAGQAYADPECNYRPSNASETKMNMPFSAVLKHGINVTHWWEDATDRKITDDDILKIKSMGFDFVRIPVSPTWLEIKDPAAQKQKLSQLRCNIISILDEGMPVILDLHPSSAYRLYLSQHPEEITQRLEYIWTELQPVTQGLPAWMLYLGLYSEPGIEQSSWWRLQEKIINDLRATYPENTFVVSPGPRDAPEELNGRRPYYDSNILYDFHFYEPTFFTRHGAALPEDEDAGKDVSPIVYPVDTTFNFDMGNPEVKKYVDQNWSRDSISVIVKTIAAWREHYNAKVACLEFGVYRGHVDDKSRYNWLRDVRNELDNVNIPWALWEYRGPSGLIDLDGHFDTGMGQALVLTQ